jgi:MFS family permease
VRRQPAVRTTTLMFMAANVGEGMLLVLLPVLARREFDGGAATYGLLLSSFALAATAGSFAVGAVSWPWTLGRSIAVAQTSAGIALCGLAFVGGPTPAALVLVVAGLLVSPMTIWAQTIRMRVIPPELRGRTFGVLRTLMQSTPPLGGAIAGLLLARGTSTAATATAMGLVMAVPGLLGLVSPALADEHTWPRELSPDPR